MTTQRIKPTINVLALPENAFGVAAPLWWGVVLMIAIESTVFLLTIATYYYVALNSETLPPAHTAPPDMLLGTIQIAILLVGAIPMFLMQRAAEYNDAPKVKLWFTVAVLISLVNVVLRYYEYYGINCRWDSNAYGSSVWLLLSLHTFHLVVTVFENILLLYWTFRHGLEPKHRLDLECNAVYWYFVVISWVVLYGVIYWSPVLIH